VQGAFLSLAQRPARGVFALGCAAPKKGGKLNEARAGGDLAA